MARGKKRSKDRHGPGRLEEDAPDTGGWLTTYADAITLLMAFFVMLYAMSQVDQVKFEALIAGFAVPFGNDSTGRSSGQDRLLDSGSGILMKDIANPNDPVDVDQRDPFETIDTQAMQVVRKGSTATDATLPMAHSDDLIAIRDEISEELEAQGLGDQVSFEFVDRGLVISITADEVLFPVGSARFLAEGRGLLDSLAPILSRFGNEIVVEGHTDDRPLQRGGYSNWNLSTDRAVAVVTTLVTEYGLAPNRLGATGFGEFRPRVPNDTPEHRALNRRVEVLIVATAEQESD